jgi:hypothetical protein
LYTVKDNEKCVHFLPVYSAYSGPFWNLSTNFRTNIGRAEWMMNWRHPDQYQSQLQ